MSDEKVQRYLEILIAKDGPLGAARYRRMPAYPLQALIPGLLYRCRLLDPAGGSTVTLTMFLRLGDLGGALWEQEMRILERVHGLAHPSLPSLEEGGYLPDRGVGPGIAYIVTKTTGTPGDQADLQRLFREHRGNALSKLWLLADALAVLADAHIAHRLLWPGNLDVTKDGDEGDRVSAVRLSRFEMGALISNLFDSGSDLGFDQVRELYLQQPPASRMYSPPERLRFMFGLPDGHLGGPLGDVFSLGLMAAEWMLGPAGDGEPPTDYDGILRRQEATRAMLVRRGHELPSALADTLHDMLDPTERGRPTAYRVSQMLATGYQDAYALLGDDLPDTPYLLAYMPGESDKTLKQQWHFIRASARTKEGSEELIDLIERDCRGAEILHSPNGAEGFVPGMEAELRQAKTVIIGHEVTWFAAALYMREDRLVEYDEIMVIRFVRPTLEIKEKLDALRVSALAGRVPVVEAIAMPTETDVAEYWRDGRPRWSSLVRRAESGRALKEEEKTYLGALNWYLLYQRALLSARTYAYVLDTSSSRPGRALLRWESTKDLARPTDGPLEAKMILDTRRAGLADFVTNGGAQAGLSDTASPQVVLSASRNGFGKAKGPYTVVGTIGTETVEVETGRQGDIPESGWLRLQSDSGTQPQIDRQTDARVELETQRVLLRQLTQPVKQPSLEAGWNEAGGPLSGEGREAVVEMLKNRTLYALQGPPGTGKTEVTAQAVADYVTARPRARVLVSAQSHNALENLAGRILDKLGMTESDGRPARLDRLALRVEGSRGRDKPDERVAAFLPARVATGIVAYSKSQAQYWLKRRRTERPELSPVVEEWLESVSGTQLELNRRIRAAANIVFATTGHATVQNLVLESTDEPFHWVLVEEAARAWPTELALPLVRGVRWTLIGDHAQIGAFSREEIERFLLECKDDPKPELAAMYEARNTYMRAFDTFAELFSAERSNIPRKTLREQYRMTKEISDLVGDTFYASSGGLEACRPPAPHPLSAPDYLRAARLIWIDTGQAERARGFWSNDNEADLCARIVRAMNPRPGDPDGPGLAVLTPYRKQQQLLTARMGEHAGRVFTVDGFQGREADVVVVSLVRDQVGKLGTPISNVGHVSSPSRANVMLSRARELLVVVGRWDIYASQAGTKWREVAEHFREHGEIVSAEKVVHGS